MSHLTTNFYQLNDNIHSPRVSHILLFLQVIYTDAIRAKGYTDEAVHVNKDNDPIKIGQQVLIDILLLAKSDCFLHGESNVATLASYFNPKMRSFSLEDMIRNQKVRTFVVNVLCGKTV